MNLEQPIECGSVSEELTFSLYEMDIQTGDILSFDIESLSEHSSEGTIQAFLDNDILYLSFEASERQILTTFNMPLKSLPILRIGWLNTDVENNEGCNFSVSQGEETALSVSNETYIFSIRTSI